MTMYADIGRDCQYTFKKSVFPKERPNMSTQDVQRSHADRATRLVRIAVFFTADDKTSTGPNNKKRPESQDLFLFWAIH